MSTPTPTQIATELARRAAPKGSARRNRRPRWNFRDFGTAELRAMLAEVTPEPEPTPEPAPVLEPTPEPERPETAVGFTLDLFAGIRLPRGEWAALADMVKSADEYQVLAEV